ncbi:unnamed protein product, partial [Gulo gulo]
MCHLDSKLTLCPLMSIRTTQIFTKTSRQIDSELFSWPWKRRPTTELSDNLSRHMDSKLTMCPWAWRQIQLSDRPNLQIHHVL